MANAQVDSLVVDSIVQRIKVILEQYNNQVLFVDTSEYLIDGYDADDINLQIASSMGACNEIIKLYLRGADVNNIAGNTATPLHYAVAEGKEPAAEILLLLGAKPDSEDRYGNTPLITAVRSGNLEISETLIRYGASVAGTDRYKSSAMHHSSALGFFYITDMLLYYEAPTELRDQEGNTPLMTGVSFGYYDIADLLLQNGADPNAPDKRGFTPLMSAAQNGDTLMMRLLIDRGANLYSTNAEGLDALGSAVLGGNKNAVEFLLKNGNRWKHSGGLTGNPSSLANFTGNREINQLLAEWGMESKKGISLDKFTFSAGGMFTTHYQMVTASLSLSDPRLHAGVTIGTAFNPLRQRMLFDMNDEALYQYRVSTSVISAGVFREFLLNKPYSENSLSLITTLSGGYRFHSLYEGTNTRPEDKFCLIPAVEIRWSRRNLSFAPGLTYLNTPFYKVSPVWFTINVAYILSGNPRSVSGKRIRLYNYEQN
jgi:ankyrin repeat protein